MQSYFRNQIVALGITTPALRAFVRERTQSWRHEWRVSEAVELCDRLLHESEFEIRAAGILALGRFSKRLTLEVLAPAEQWLTHRLDNWALVDTFCGSILSPMLERFTEVELALTRWSRAKPLWLRRAALVALVPSARHGRRLNLAYRLAKEHLPDPEDLMHKATGWLLREASKTDPARLRSFLLRYGPVVPRTAVRYAIERFPAGERTDLLVRTRGPLGHAKVL